MKNKKGFTLVELLGVIVIISAIALIVLPPVINQLGSSEGRVDEVTKSLIREATTLYVDYNKSDFDFEEDVLGNKRTVCLTIGDLLESNFLEGPLYYANGDEIDSDLYVEGDLFKMSIKNVEIKESCEEKIEPAFSFVVEVESGDLDFGFAANSETELMVDWGDENTSNYLGSDRFLHTYSEPGEYNIVLYGEPSRISFCRLVPSGWGCDSSLTPEKLVSVVSDLPRSVNSTARMFQNATNFNSSLNHWDTSNVEDMSSMFNTATSFNQDLNNWDTSNVENMAGMFSDAYSFNGNINSWDVSNVLWMNAMFQFSGFNRTLNSWNVSSVEDMSYMFYYSDFNGDVSAWDVSNVVDMHALFMHCDDFNQDISNWNTSSAEDMSYMFYRASSFNQDISRWHTSNVEYMDAMFYAANQFNQDISTKVVNQGSPNEYVAWDVSNVRSFGWSFLGARSLDQDISNWNTSNVTFMGRMFENTDEFNADISSWDVSNVTNFDTMFRNASAFNQDLSGWCVDGISSTPTNFDQNASSWTLPRPSWGTCPDPEGDPPEINFSPNGDTTWSRSHSTNINVTSPSGNNISNVYYAWSTTTTQPSNIIQSASVSQSINTPTTIYEGNRYLWIRAIDEFGNESIERSEAFRQDRRGPTVSSSSSVINCRITINDASDDGVGLATNYTRKVLPSTTDWGTDTVFEGQAGSGYVSVEVRDALGNTTTRSLNCDSGGGGSVEVCDPPCGPYTHCCNGSCIHMTLQCDGAVQ